MLKIRKILLCNCDEFIHWYTDDDIKDEPIDVCWCGHLQTDHLDGHGSCIGEVIVT